VLRDLREGVAYLPHLLAVAICVASCSIGQRITWRRTWREQDPTAFVQRSRKWPAWMPRIAGAVDVEWYGLRDRGEVLFFRSMEGVGEVWEEVFSRMQGAGFRMGMQRGNGWRRTFSACKPDCDTRRYYGMVTTSYSEGTHAVVRSSLPPANAPALAGECTEITVTTDLVQDAQLLYRTLLDLDLDRDGVLDPMVPRVLEDRNRDGRASREETVWDLYVMRGECGHFVGRIPDQPRADHFLPVGEHGLIDLVVVRRVEERHVTERYAFDGQRYVLAEQSPR
jgi:hypothetical protein